MPINFLVTDIVTIDGTFIQKHKSLLSKESLFTLRTLNNTALEVLDVGNLTCPDKSYIKVKPKFKKARARAIFFERDDLLNSSFNKPNVEYLPIEELLKDYDPFERLSREIGVSFKKEDAPIGLLEEKQVEHVIPGNRLVLRAGEPKSLIWDWGRVRFFLEQPPSERRPIPITELDGSYLILDGNHRICAAILRGDQFIPVIKLNLK